MNSFNSSGNVWRAGQLDGTFRVDFFLYITCGFGFYSCWKHSHSLRGDLTVIGAAK